MNLLKKSNFVRRETLKIHKILPETRIASSLSCVEIYVALFYGKIIKFNPKKPNDEDRDRFIISKGHGAISLYPILADLGFFDKKELKNVGKNFLGSIPDPIIPGIETVNGSLGNGLGIGCGISLALRTKKSLRNVIVLGGDGELYEGSVWEAIMFASHHQLDNLTFIIDNNKVSMLDYCKNIIDLDPITDKFKSFNWDVYKIKKGNDVFSVYETFKEVIPKRNGKPKVIIVETIKGKGVPFLEKSRLSHVLTIPASQIDKYIEEFNK